jgi:hypothetical protein
MEVFSTLVKMVRIGIVLESGSIRRRGTLASWTLTRAPRYPRYTHAY